MKGLVSFNCKHPSTNLLQNMKQIYNGYKDKTMLLKLFQWLMEMKTVVEIIFRDVWFR